MARIEFDKRKAHIKRLFAVTKSENDIVEEDRTLWIDMYRIDQCTYIPEDGKKFLVYLNWLDKPTDPAQTTKESEENLALYGRKITTKRLTNPQFEIADNEHPDFWFNIPIIDSIRLVNPQGQVYELKFFNENPELIALLKDEAISEEDKKARRKLWLRRVVHWDTDEYPEEENVYVPALEYTRKGDEDTEQYIDQEVPNVIHIIETTEPISQHTTLIMFNHLMARNFRNKTLEDIKTERQSKLPPIRLDPFQQIVNCQIKIEPDPVDQTLVFRFVDTDRFSFSPPESNQPYADATYTEFVGDTAPNETPREPPPDGPAYITSKAEDDFETITLIRGAWPEKPTFDTWPKSFRKRGKLVISYTDADPPFANWKIYASSDFLNWYKNDVYDETLDYQFKGLQYVKSVSTKDKEKLGFTPEQSITDLIHICSSSGVTVFNVRTKIEVKNIFDNTYVLEGTTYTDSNNIFDLAGFKLTQSTIDSDFDGNIFAVSEDTSDAVNTVGVVTHHILKWDKYGKKLWQVDSPMISRVTNPVGGSFVAEIRWAAVVGRCYIFMTFNSFSNADPPYGADGVSAYPQDSGFLGVDKNGVFILDELMGLEFTRNDVLSFVKEYGYLFFHGVSEQGPSGSVSSEGDPNSYHCVYPRLPKRVTT